VLAAILYALAAPQLRDFRHLAIALVLALGYYTSAGIPWAMVRVQWIYMVVVISVVASINALITGGQSGDFSDQPTHVLWTLPPFGTEISAEGISLVVSQVLRFMGIAAVSFPLAFAVAPGDLGLAFRRLGLGDRMAIMVDLTIRFIPTLGSEFTETIDAQRVRGYDPAQRGGGPITRLRRLSPVFVPVTIGALASAEDTIDAMDLRAFGTGRRTWLRQLAYDMNDRLVIAGFVAFLVAATFLNLTGQTEHALLPMFR
jgi:energy-coupling factor transport system permease protein